MENELNNFDMDIFVIVFDNNVLFGNDIMEEKFFRIKEIVYNKGKFIVVYY